MFSYARFASTDPHQPPALPDQWPHLFLKRSGEHFDTVLEHGALIREFVSGMTFETYVEDPRTRLAVERSFEIIGEALKRAAKIEPAIVEELPEFRKIISFRNILAHCYDGIEEKIVWGTIEGPLPCLMSRLRQMQGCP